MFHRRNLLIFGGFGLAASLLYAVRWAPATVAPTPKPPVAAPASAARGAPPAPQPAPVALEFHPSSGEALAYHFAMNSDSDVDVAYLLRTAGANSKSSSVSTGERQKVEVKTEGTLNLKFFEASPTEWNVAAKITDLTYTMAGQISPETGALGQPFSFTFKADGTLGDFHFTPGVSKKAQDASRQILSWFQVVLPKEPRSTWSAQETDATGTFLSRYSLVKVDGNDLTLSKKKTVYASMAASLTSDSGDTAANVLLSQISIHMPRSGAWIGDASLSEKLVLSTRGRDWGKVTSTGSVKRLPGGGMATWPDAYAAFEQQLQSTQYLSSQQYETDPTLSALWANYSVPQAIRRFAELLSSDRKLAESLMVNFLREDPSRSAQLVRELDASTKSDTGIDETTRLTLWRLNAKAGHKEAQKAQIEAAMSPASSRATRMNALGHLDFKNPEGFVVDDLLRLRRNTVRSPDPTERELGSMALLSLGALGDASHPNQAMNQRISQELLGYLASTKQPADTAAALQAIGNSGNPAVIKTVVPYLDSSYPEVRTGALEAFRRMNDPQATQILIQQFEQKTDQDTRRVALRSLSSMPATAEAMSWGRTALATPMDTDTQAQLAAWLGSQHTKYPENEVALRQLLKTTSSFEVKKGILKYIAP